MTSILHATLYIAAAVIFVAFVSGYRQIGVLI